MCARCPAEADIVVARDGRGLAFCREHFKRHELELAIFGWEVIRLLARV